MRIGIRRAFRAGFVAIAARIVFRYAAARFGLYGMDAPAFLGGFFSFEPEAALWLGLGTEFLMGAALFPILYVLLAQRTARWRLPRALLGWFWGLLLWALWAAAAMPLLSYYHPQITAGILQDPGLFLLNLGPTAPLESLLGFSIYGILFGWLCGKGSR